MSSVKAWIEAMRLRTLPVSVSGVICAAAYAVQNSVSPRWVPGALCLIFAVLAQVASNFANEYYDFKAGLDKSGREGPRRGVTEGDIAPQAMKEATFATLVCACMIGCLLIIWGGWWLIAVGLLIATGVLAYSTGPYPLSQHGLGEVAVTFFFGIIPVNFTYYLMTDQWAWNVAIASLSMGLLGANVLIVNNYRDIDDDRAVGKRTSCVILGRKITHIIYLVNGLLAIFLMLPTWDKAHSIWIPAFATVTLFRLWREIGRRSGSKLNPMLGATAMFMFLYTLALFVTIIITAK